jgi:UDPglucose 6-dehydrogenase
MKVTVFGAGYVGLVTSACLAEMGNSVVCVDVNPARVAALQRGELPIHEPGLPALVERNAAARRLQFTLDAEAAVAASTLIFIAVGTPADEDGSADLRHVLAVAQTIGRHMADYKVVVDKSTVPVGTAAAVREAIAAELRTRAALIPYAVVSNPEFLKEGAAVEDFMRPDRVIVGSDDERAALLMRALYEPFLRNRDRLLVMDPASAELAKYAANAMLATRISFMNELAALAERLGADIEQVRRGIGSDARIGTHFLYAGCGWGGSCFPKDVRALQRMAGDAGVDLPIVAAAEAVNRRQRRLLAERVFERFGSDLRGRVFGLWGLAFKPETDDLREAPAVEIVRELLHAGAHVRAYDPQARPDAAALWGADAAFEQVGHAEEAARGASALLLVTEWREFRSPDFAALAASMREPVLFDGRNLYSPWLVRAAGFEYVGIGRPVAAAATSISEPLPLALAA